MESNCPFQDYPGHIRFLKGNQKRGMDNFIVVHGPVGAGKNTIAGNLALDLKEDFDIRRDIVHTHDDLLRLIVRRADMNPEESAREVTIINEGADIFFSREWNTIENKEGTKLQRKTRILGGTMIITIPDFEGLDPYIRESRCWQRIYQPLDFDADGFVHTPAKVLWRTERFDYNDQRVTHRWTDVYDLNVPSLDDHPQWRGYEHDKRMDVKATAQKMMERINDPARRGRRLGQGRRGRRNKSANTPPTTT